MAKILLVFAALLLVGQKMPDIGNVRLVVGADAPLVCHYQDGAEAPWCAFYSPSEYNPAKGNGWHWGGQVHPYAPMSEEDAQFNDLSMVCRAGVLKGGYITHLGVLYKDCTDGPGWLNDFVNPDGSVKPLPPMYWATGHRDFCLQAGDFLTPEFVTAALTRAMDIWNSYTGSFAFRYAGECGPDRDSLLVSALGVNPARLSVDPRALAYATPLADPFTGALFSCDIGLVNVPLGYDLNTVVLHEMGHCLGLEHSWEGHQPQDWVPFDRLNSVMFWRAFPDQVKLPNSWDIEQVRLRYSG